MLCPNVFQSRLFWHRKIPYGCQPFICRFVLLPAEMITNIHHLPTTTGICLVAKWFPYLHVSKNSYTCQNASSMLASCSRLSSTHFSFSALLVWHHQIFWCMHQVLHNDPWGSSSNGIFPTMLWMSKDGYFLHLTAPNEISNTHLQTSCSCASGPRYHISVLVWCFSFAPLVQFLIIHSPPWLPIPLAHYYQRARQSTGLPAGTRMIIPLLMSSSNCRLTSASQSLATDVGVWKAVGWASGNRWMWCGGPFIMGSVIREMLNTEPEKCCFNHSSRWGMFSSIGVRGSLVGLCGMLVFFTIIF